MSRNHLRPRQPDRGLGAALNQPSGATGGRPWVPPGGAVLWFLLGFFLAAVAGVVALTWLAWQGARQAERFQAQLEAVWSERTSLASQIHSLQSTVASLQGAEADDVTQQIAALQAQLEAASGASQLTDLETSLSDMQTRVTALQSMLDGLAARITALEAEKALPPKVRLAVARQKQSHTLSCEASAASMVAQFHGLDLTEADVLSALPRNKDPNLGFRGSIDGTPGAIQDYGVYAGPISAILDDEGLQARLVVGGLTGIRAAIARGNPVIAWVTYNLQVSTPTSKTVNGKSVTLVPYQHVVVVTGYNADGFLANDPWDGQEHLYPAEDLERALGYLDNMALEVGRP